MTIESEKNAPTARATLADAQPGGRVRLGTPGARWAATGEPDPHGTRYDCERSELAMGNLSDDELANAVFINGDRNLTFAQMTSGELPGSAYLAAAKDRIRWLSRALAAAEALSAHPSPGGQGNALADEVDLVRAVLDGYSESIARTDALRATRVIRAALAARQPVGEPHPDDLAVDAFAAAMKAKMAAARAKGRGGWEDPAQCTADDLSRMLRDHVEKGDPRDVANFCMMLHQRGESISARQPVGEPVAFQLAGSEPLWCLHVLGMDDVHPAPSKAHAEKAAAWHNEQFKDQAARLGISIEAKVVPWPHSAESHADGVAEFIPQWLIPQWQLDALEANAKQPAQAVDLGQQQDAARWRAIAPHLSVEWDEDEMLKRWTWIDFKGDALSVPTRTRESYASVDEAMDAVIGSQAVGSG